MIFHNLDYSVLFSCAHPEQTLRNDGMEQDNDNTTARVIAARLVYTRIYVLQRVVVMSFIRIFNEILGACRNYRCSTILILV